MKRIVCLLFLVCIFSAQLHGMAVITAAAQNVRQDITNGNFKKAQASINELTQRMQGVKAPGPKSALKETIDALQRELMTAQAAAVQKEPSAGSSNQPAQQPPVPAQQSQQPSEQPSSRVLPVFERQPASKEPVMPVPVTKPAPVAAPSIVQSGLSEQPAKTIEQAASPSAPKQQPAKEEMNQVCIKNKDADMADFYLSTKNPLVPVVIKDKFTSAASAPLIGQYGAPYNLASPLLLIENNEQALDNVPSTIMNVISEKTKSITPSIDFFTIIWSPVEKKPQNSTYNIIFHQVVRNWLRQEGSTPDLHNFNVGIEMGLFEPQGVRARSIALNNVKKESVHIHPSGNLEAFSPNNAQFEVVPQQKIVSFWTVAFSPDNSRVMIVFNVFVVDPALGARIDENINKSNNLQTLRENLSSLALDSADDQNVLNDAIDHLERICEPNTIKVDERVYLLPDIQKLKALGVCPPFDVASLFTEPLYNVEINGTVEPRYAATKDVSCSLAASAYRGYKINLFQLRTVNQSTQVNNESVFKNECPTLSLRNALIMGIYARTGNENILKDLYDAKAAYAFMRDIGCVKDLTADLMEPILALNAFAQMDKERLFILDDPRFLDPAYHPDFATNEQKIMRETLAQGLKRDHFYCTWIMGNGDERDKGVYFQHWYTITLIKDGSRLDYIVTDTVTHYHLQPGSYDLKRLENIIALMNSYLPEQTSSAHERAQEIPFSDPYFALRAMHPELYPAVRGRYVPVLPRKSKK